jgi:hypothetical protein
MVAAIDQAAPNAIAVRGGVVLAVGAQAELASLTGPATRTITFPGATVTPGYVDAHSHPIMGIDMTRGAELRDCVSFDDLRAALRCARSCTASSRMRGCSAGDSTRACSTVAS